MFGQSKTGIAVAKLCLLYVMMSTRVSGAIITVASIQSEGLACIAMAKAIPGLQKMAGASLNRVHQYRMTLWFVEVGYQLIPNLDTAIWFAPTNYSLNLPDLSPGKTAWSTAPSTWSSHLRPSSFRNIDNFAANIAHEMTSATDTLQMTQPSWCSFQGVTCGSVSRNLSFASIISIDLTDRALTGTLPAIIGNFASMSYFSLQGNKIYGKIPNTVGAWSLIQTIDLDGNSLSGTIPYTICALKSIRQLYLNMNQLVGSIPKFIGELTSLMDLTLSSNHLTGTIPTNIGSLRSLQTLHLHENSLTGSIPSSIGTARSLKMLTAYSNNLSGSIPNAIGELRLLVGLYLYSNSLTGTIPVNIGSLRSLQMLYLQENSLTGPIPTSMGSLTSLRMLNANSNALAGSVPNSISELRSLVGLYLNSNSLTGTIPANIMSLEKLKYAEFQYNLLVDTTSVESTPKTLSNLIEEDVATPAISVSVSPLAVVVTAPSCTHLCPDNISSQESISHNTATSSTQLESLSTHNSIVKTILPFNGIGATMTSKSAQEQTWRRERVHVLHFSFPTLHFSFVFINCFLSYGRPITFILEKVHSRFRTPISHFFHLFNHSFLFFLLTLFFIHPSSFNIPLMSITILLLKWDDNLALQNLGV